MRIKSLLQKRLLAASLVIAFSASGVEGAKLKITAPQPAAPTETGSLEEAMAEGLLRSMPGGVPAGTAGAAGPVGPLTFGKILNNQTATGSDIFLQSTSAAPDIFSITRILRTFNAAGRAQLSPIGFAPRNPLTVNGTAVPANAAGGPAYVNPLYNQRPAAATVAGDYVAAVPQASLRPFFIPIADQKNIITTGYANPAGITAGTALAAPTIAFDPLTDAAGQATAQIRAITAGNGNEIFAAVSSNGVADFTADAAINRGIARVKLNNNTLQQALTHVQASAVGFPAAPALRAGVNGVQATPLDLRAVNAAAAAAAPGLPAALGALGAVAAGPDYVGAAFSSAVPGPAVLASATLANGGVMNPLGGTGVVLHYDKELDRLFVGLKGLRKLNPVGREGGLVSVLVGTPAQQVDAGGVPVVGSAFDRIVLRSIFHKPVAAVLENTGAANEENLADRILALYHNPAGGNVHAALVANQVHQTADVFVSVHQLKTMHTSTGRSYLIVASEVGERLGIGGARRSNTGLYFVPIMGKRGFLNTGVRMNFDAPADVVGKVCSANHDAIVTIDPAGVVAAAAGAFGTYDAATARAALPLAGTNCISNTIEILHDGASRVRSIPLEARNITDLQVVGDSVFVSVSNGNDGQPQFFGVYQTTALFNAAGNIVGWTPLQRVSGTDKASALAVDSVNGTVMYLNDGGNTFNLAEWNQNQVATQELLALINQHFPASQGGVRAIHTFDAKTPTFREGLLSAAGALALNRQLDQQCALLVVLGYDKVMVVQTAFNNRVAQHFRDAAAPIPGRATFAGAGNDIQNVFVFNSTTNPDLKKIAPLTCAEVLKVVRNANSTEGNLYIGGFGGVCRLEPAAIPATGAGWEINNGAGAGTGLRNFVAETAGMTFKKLANAALKDVRKIISTLGAPGAVNNQDGTHVVALLGNGYVAAQGNDLVLAAARTPLPLNTKLAFDAVLVKGGLDGTVAAPGAATNANLSRLILATEQGLVVQEMAAADNHLVRLKNDDMPIQLAYEPRDRGGATGGNAFGGYNSGAGILYVLAGSQANGETRIYRFAVQFAPAGNPDQVLQQIGTEKPLSLPTFRRYFGTDGLQFLFGHDMALDTGEMLNQVMLSNPASSPLPLTGVLGNVALGSFMAGAPVREAVSGAWMVPGSFGLKVND